jgi:uncharacterized protein
MDNPKRIYELLLDYCSDKVKIDNVVIGLVWTLCRSKDYGSTGLAMSPGFSSRTLGWSGSLSERTATDLAAWIWEWDPYQASVAMAVINCCVNRNSLPESIILDKSFELPNLAVFEHFLPQIKAKNVVVIGHYPGIERYQSDMVLSILEKQPASIDYPDAACEFLVPRADWVFLTASSITNKTFPRLAELANDAKTVLMGPTTPWLPQLHEFGIDYIAGVEVCDADQLQKTVSEGGGVRIFEKGLFYRLAELAPANSLTWLKQQIGDTVTERNQLLDTMENWYQSGNASRFPNYALLEQVSSRLSRLDSSYKALWDQQALRQC